MRLHNIYCNATRDHSCGTHGALMYVRGVSGAEAAKSRARKALCGLEWWVDALSSTHNRGFAFSYNKLIYRRKLTSYVAAMELRHACCMSAV